MNYYWRLLKEDEETKEEEEGNEEEDENLINSIQESGEENVFTSDEEIRKIIEKLKRIRPQDQLTYATRW